MKKFSFYGKLFWSTFTLSAFTFGGGYVIIPLMRKKFVEKFHWLEEEEMLDLTAIAQATPGAMAVNAAVLAGYRLRGLPGAVVTLVATVLPPLIILAAISQAYRMFRSNPYVDAAMRGMFAAIGAVIVDAVYAMAKGIVKEKSVLSILLLAAAFLANYFLQTNVILIIITAALIGIARSRRQKKTEGAA